ncbi:MAG TPA: AAA family ATPase [Chloroflexota bacterium]|nr:AAA family ATPase [Chloroflexota bacterium]
MPIIAVANQKGGVGKTTSTLNLGAALQEAGKRVLLIDFDPQGNLSVAAGVVDIDAAYPSIGDLLTLSGRGRTLGAPTIETAIVATPAGMDLVPSNGTLSAAELGLVSSLNRESALSVLLKPIESRYDYILIDCLPSLGLLAINALRAANGIIIPVQADFLAIQGLAQIFETIAAVREQLNPDLNILGVVLTLVDQRTAHSREVVRVVRSSLSGQVNVFETEVRLHVALKEAARAGRTILDFDSKSRSADAYRQLALEVLQVCGDAAAPPVTLAGQPGITAEQLLDLPELVAAVPHYEQPIPFRPRQEEAVVARVARADAPRFETFVAEGWEPWLGVSS